MENSARSERSRNAAIQAALTIISRDGPGRLTLDAIALESGISKGGVMHHFRTKQAVLKALLEHQISHFENFFQDYMAGPGSMQAEAHLSAEILTLRAAIGQPQSIALALVAALAEEPGLMSIVREADAKKIASIKAEAKDPDLAVLRWAAAWGLMLTAMLGFCPLPEEERDRLFVRLLDGVDHIG